MSAEEFKGVEGVGDGALSIFEEFGKPLEWLTKCDLAVLLGVTYSGVEGAEEQER